MKKLLLASALAALLSTSVQADFSLKNNVYAVAGVSGNYLHYSLGIYSSPGLFYPGVDVGVGFRNLDSIGLNKNLRVESSGGYVFYRVMGFYDFKNNSKSVPYVGAGFSNAGVAVAGGTQYKFDKNYYLDLSGQASYGTVLGLSGRVGIRYDF